MGNTNNAWVEEFKDPASNWEQRELHRTYEETYKQTVETPQMAQQWAEDFEKEKVLGKEEWQEDFDSWAKENGSNSWVEAYQNFTDKSQEWLESYENFNETEGDWVQQYEGFKSEGPLKEYIFQEDNPYLNTENPFEKGLELFKQGNIPEAILAFEASVIKGPNFSQGWQYLGRAQAENDKDDLAIPALVRAIETDPNNLDALLNLGVSYTNDFHREKALRCLVQWLTANQEYKHLSDLAKLPDGDYDISHDTVSELFLEAARMKAHDPDPDVQIVLGLLYNISYEYPKAIDCFKTALIKRPEDYLLWNRLGATQANGSRSADALEAYYRALSLKPTYTRARSNLGISFLSLGNHVEAAKSFLGALSINPNAQHLWDHLSAVFTIMGRKDLLELMKQKDVELFKKEFVF